jgi:hypothetical protein
MKNASFATNGAQCFFKQKLLYLWQYKLALAELLFLIQQFVLCWTGKNRCCALKKLKDKNWHTMILI